MVHPSHLLVDCIITYGFDHAPNSLFTDMPPPAPEFPRNRVIIEDWPDPDDDFNNSDNENDNHPPANGEDQDPPYVEPDPERGLDPEDEPALNEDELWAFLHAELGDLADDEWIDMCKYILYNLLCKTDLEYVRCSKPD
jgi:hypothetical protein